MPTSDSSNHLDDRERDRDRDPERGDRGDRGGSRQKPSATAASKSKDLSHVPCKFYKVGGCTAGSSCPFSHSMAEPGGQKETCAWFVKGNCKFGHKCALAHILPGQSMAMDRKNKKAAQVAAAAANGGERLERGGKDGKGGRGGGNPKREGHTPGGAGPGATNTGNRNPLLAGGSTAPTRILAPSASTPAGRPPMTMPLKATLSPSAPAPPLASFGVLDDLEGAGVQLASAPAQGKRASIEVTLNPLDTTPTQESEAQLKPNTTSSPVPLPPSAPRPTATSAKTQLDFGPIGSPPTSGSHTSPTRLHRNGAAFNPGSSPQHINGISVVPGSPTQNNDNNFLSTSPFSAPGTQSVFLSGGGSYNGSGGMAASLGSGLAMMGGRKGWGSGESGSVGTGAGGFAGMVPSSVQQRMNGGRGDYDIGFEYEEYGRRSGLGIGRGSGLRGGDIAVEDEDLEDFLPSSLTDLLTPEERNRRMSRSNSGQGPSIALGVSGAGFGGGELSSGTGGGGAGAGGLGMGHRYSRSVPAPSLLGDIKSIWADTSAHPMPSSPPTHRGTPSSSFTSRFDQSLGMSHASGDEMGLSMSMGSAGGGMMGMSPSNASAAFLPGLHSHYLSAKAKQAQAAQLGLGAIGRGVRGTSGPLYGTTGTNNSTMTNNYLLGGSGLSPSANNTHTYTHSNAQHSYRAAPSPFDLTQQQHHHHLAPQPHTSRPIPSNGNATNNSNTNDDPHQGTHLLSPSSRALQSHAPGQSLPQGLAAGYSRIHALPPPPSLASPGSASIFGNGTPPGLEGAGIPGSGPYGGWAAAASPPSGNASGLDSMFSRLSYSAAAAARATPTQSNTNPNVPTTTNNMSPPGLQRNVSGGRYPQQAQGPLSPLNGPAVTRDDDDDLFSMDG